MFESDGDWDLDIDQDFLDDIDEKAAQYYSQSESTTKDDSKKRKTEYDCSTSKDNTIPCTDASRKSRTDMVLGLFNRTCPKKSDPVDNACTRQSPNKGISKSGCSETSDKGNDNARKNLVLGILTSKNASVSQKTEINIKDSCKSSLSINNKREGKACDKVELKPQQTTYNNQNKVPDEASSVGNISQRTKGSDTLRKQMVLDLLKQYPAHKKPVKPNITLKSPIKVHQVTEKVALVRKFPGPAGLLPDKLEGGIPPVSYWNSIEETENKRPAESNFSEFCSQNTKNLFSEGAWQHMLDDLPPDFLKDYDIVSMKRRANSNDNKSTKVEFLAGIIEFIDHSHDNPSIVLKDFTDSIEGIVHHDIPSKYPGLLEPNVVLLLRDVGLLRVAGFLLSSKYNILISPSSLLGIYSNKGDIIHTPQMKAIFGDDLSENQENPPTSTSTSNKNKSNKLLAKDSTDTQSSHNILSQETLELVNDTINFDDTDDFSFCVDSSEITNTQNLKNFASSSSGNHDSEAKSKRTLINLKKLSSNTKAQQPIVPVRETTKTTEKLLSISDYDLNEVDLDDTIKDVTQKTQPNIEKKINTNPGNTKSSVRSKLSKFRSNDVLTQTDSKESFDQKTQLPGSKLFESTPWSKENDSDDEMLSQLDVNTIFSNYD